MLWGKSGQFEEKNPVSSQTLFSTMLQQLCKGCQHAGHSGDQIGLVTVVTESPMRNKLEGSWMLPPALTCLVSNSDVLPLSSPGGAVVPQNQAAEAEGNLPQKCAQHSAAVSTLFVLCK